MIDSGGEANVFWGGGRSRVCVNKIQVEKINN